MNNWDELKKLCSKREGSEFSKEVMNGTILALIAENEALRKDAERYRWLRDSCHLFAHYRAITWRKDAMDKEIDGCMSKEPRNV